MEHTLTNAQRVAEITKLREIAQNEANYCDKQIAAPILVKCNCIVATADAGYQVTVNEETHKAEVLHGNYSNPCHFTERLATKIANEIHASNGFGPLAFIVWGWRDFYKARRNNLQAHLDLYDELIAKFTTC
jgi:hypothetical protein